MAEAALFGIAKSVLKQLASPAVHEFRLLWGHKANLEKLEDTVTTISNVLQDADHKQATDAAVRGWLARLRIALYEADDLFDIISAKVLIEKNKTGSKIGKEVRHFLSKPYRFAFVVKTAHKVKAIRERLDDIALDIHKFNFLSVQTNLDPISSIIGREQTHSFVPRNEFVGREEEIEDVVRMLLPDSSQELKGVSVISVIGIGGLGKTTLAKLIYNDERVQQGFELCLWACINYFSNLKQVLITLLKSATKSEPQNLELDQLQSLFRKEIEGKRFLLVLDDVWDEDPQNWRELKHLLSSGREGSMVLTTTRSELVAQSLCATKPYFHLQGMSNENAWLLFKKIAFEEEEDRNNSEWERLGQRIVRKCANVPLAIITIASLLREKEKEKWLPLVNDELSKVFPDEYKKITHVLEISYKELPCPIKRCFGYCSLFPKDYEFDKGSLIRLWIAQGFVESLVDHSLEDRAGDYFFYLVKRCFFQLATIDKVTERITYRMHDLMHDLATEVAGSESMLFDETLHVSWDKNVRHVSINCEIKSMVDHVCSFSHSKSLRTFLCHYTHYSLRNKYPKKLMSSFKSLRVLDLSKLSMFHEVPTSIGELIHLRFLDLSKNYMERLPVSICSLIHLQSLILQDCTYLMELPEDLGNLVSLRHLVLQGCRSLVKMPAGLGALASLVTLDKLVVHNPTTYLRCKHLFPLVEEFSVTGVQEELIWQAIGREATSSTPQVNCSMLKSLEISKVGDLRSIGEAQIRHLSALRELLIYNCDQLETLSCNGIAYLTSLEKLQIWNCEQLNNWVHSDDQKAEVRKIHSLPRLKHLEIPTVNRNLFKGLKYTASLEILIIKNSFNQELQEGGEEEEEGMPWKNLQKLTSMELGFGETFSMRSNQSLLHGFQHLTSLQELRLCKCKELYLSWRVLLGLNHLWILNIEDVEEVIDVDSDTLTQTQFSGSSIRLLNIDGGEWVNVIPWKSFPFLEQLKMRKLERLPEGVQHLSTLQWLEIKDISECVVSLPHWMSSLSPLCSLHISGSSSELKKRCERLTGEDWPKIQHIQEIIIE